MVEEILLNENIPIDKPEPLPFPFNQRAFCRYEPIEKRIETARVLVVDDLLRDERIRAFVETTRLFGEPISVGGLHVGLAESLVRAGKLDNATIISSLHSGTWPTLLGNLAWSADGAPTGEFNLVQWQKGKLLPVYPPSVAQAKPEVGPLPDDPAAVRGVLGDGSYGGAYARSDEDVLAVWAVGVAETRERIESLT